MRERVQQLIQLIVWVMPGELAACNVLLLDCSSPPGQSGSSLMPSAMSSGWGLPGQEVLDLPGNWLAAMGFLPTLLHLGQHLTLAQ